MSKRTIATQNCTFSTSSIQTPKEYNLNMPLNKSRSTQGPINFKDQHPRLYIPSFKAVGSVVLEKKIFQGFYNIWAWWPSLSSDRDEIYKFPFFLCLEMDGRTAPLRPWICFAEILGGRRGGGDVTG